MVAMSDAVDDGADMTVPELRRISRRIVLEWSRQDARHLQHSLSRFIGIMARSPDRIKIPFLERFHRLHRGQSIDPAVIPIKAGSTHDNASLTHGRVKLPGAWPRFMFEVSDVTFPCLWYSR